MRPRSDLDIALLQAPGALRSTYCKVEVDPTKTGSWVALNNWNGLDFVRSVSFDDALGSNAWTATVKLALYLQDRPELSLSPLMTTSLPNANGALCEVNTPIRISTATLAMDGIPSAYNLVFPSGRIDKYSINSGEITLTARNPIGVLQDRFVENELQYGSDTPTTATANELQEILQNLIDDHYNTAVDIGGTASAPRTSKLSARTTDGSPVQLYSANGTAITPWNAADDTGWSLRRFRASKSPLWQWLIRLAEMNGSRLRYRWHSGTGIDNFVLVLESPDRSSPSSVITLDPKIGQCAVMGIDNAIIDVRNFWRVGFQLDGGRDDSRTALDASSQTKYNRRFAEAMEGSASQIDTGTEAQNYANRLLSDTKEPIAFMRVMLPYLWYLESGDMITIAADNIHFSSDKTLEIVQRSNTIAQGGPAVTNLSLQGTVQSNGRRKPQREYPQVRRDLATTITTAATRFGILANADFGLVAYE